MTVLSAPELDAVLAVVMAAMSDPDTIERLFHADRREAARIALSKATRKMRSQLVSRDRAASTAAPTWQELALLRAVREHDRGFIASFRMMKDVRARGWVTPAGSGPMWVLTRAGIAALAAAETPPSP